MTLIEIMVAAAIFAVVAFILVGLIYEYDLGSKRLSSVQASRAGIAHLLDQWESDQSSADSVFIPDTDVLRADNTANPHEVDFYSKDASNRPYYWAYYYDPAAHTLQRYDYPSPGSTATKDGNALRAITQFTPSLHAISEVTNPRSPIYFPIFGGTRDFDVKLGAGSNAIGGTHIVHIDVATAKEIIPVELEANGAPSGFTVVLNYTPAPKVLDMRTWPVAVKYGASGADVAALPPQPRFDLALLINSMLGGGVANAAGCHAIAYTNSQMLPGQEDTVGIPGHPTSTIGTQAGCFDGNMVAYDANGQSATYQVNSAKSTCDLVSHVVPTGWNPGTAAGKQVVLVVHGGSPTPTCSLAIDNGTGQVTGYGTGLVAAQVALSCSSGITLPIGQTCQFSFLPGGPYNAVCLVDSWSLGWTGSAWKVQSVTPTGLGTVTDNGDGTFSFTRTSVGTVTIQGAGQKVTTATSNGATTCLLKFGTDPLPGAGGDISPITIN